MKFFVNKNLIHNGKSYAKGHMIKESDDGFKALLEMGHVEEVKHHEKAEVKSETKPVKPAKPESKPE